jgi:hypothetical protein
MAISEYIPTQWVDNAAPAINAANLNHIEHGIKNDTDETIRIGGEITRIDNEIADLDTRVIAIEDKPDYVLPGATPTKLGGIRVEVVDNGDGTYTGKIWTSE